tara:strand:- start:247 stop:426 length:180 start_codon:yes stop_codon:yes gene_type:complete
MSEEVIVNKKQLWQAQAPALNFEYDEDALLQHALEVGFVESVGDDLYKVNMNYGENSDE